MINLKYILLITVVFILGGCTDMGHCFTKAQTIENKSNIEIVIISYRLNYDSNQHVFSKKITLKNNDIIHKEAKSCPPSFSGPDFASLVEGDSIVIDYGDKIKSYSMKTLDTDNRNPFRLDSENKSHNFVYTITPEDYANAKLK